MSQEEAERDFRRMRGLTDAFSGGSVTVVQSGDEWEASLTANPSIFELSSVSGYDALGKLVHRVWPVRLAGFAARMER